MATCAMSWASLKHFLGAYRRLTSSVEIGAYGVDFVRSELGEGVPIPVSEALHVSKDLELVGILLGVEALGPVTVVSVIPIAIGIRVSSTSATSRWWSAWTEASTEATTGTTMRIKVSSTTSRTSWRATKATHVTLVWVE